MVRHLSKAAGGLVVLACCALFLPAQVSAQDFFSGAGGGIVADPFAFYYAFYLPNQQMQAMRPTPMDSINQALVARQYYAQADRRGLYNPISPYASDQTFDPLRPYGPQGQERIARRITYNTDPGAFSGPSLYFNRAAQYFPGLATKTGRGANANVYTRGARLSSGLRGRGGMGGGGGFGGGMGGMGMGGMGMGGMM
jgi:hypothetical protein